MAKNSERKENASSTVSDSTKSIAEKTFDFAAYRQEVLEQSRKRMRPWKSLRNIATESGKGG